MLTILEWLAFGLGALTVFLYGQSNILGAACGVLCAMTFMLWGSLSELWGACAINIGFLFLHGRNFWKFYHEPREKN